MLIHHITPSDYRRMPWKNGSGWTTEIAVSPGPSKDMNSLFDWRVSIAEIENDCYFSTFSGYERIICLLDGAGMELQFDNSPPIQLHDRKTSTRFAGEWQTRCRLTAGATRDFNVMTRRDSTHADLQFRPVAGSLLLFVEPETQWLAYLANGHITVDSNPQFNQINSGDTLLFSPARQSIAAVKLVGTAELLLVKLTRNNQRTAPLNPNGRP